jgi:hypothetical protein
LRVVEREKDMLLGVVDKERSGGRFTPDVVKAAARLLRKVDPTIPAPEIRATGCTVS